MDEEFKIGVFFCGSPVVGEILADPLSLVKCKGKGGRAQFLPQVCSFRPDHDKRRPHSPETTAFSRGSVQESGHVGVWLDSSKAE